MTVAERVRAFGSSLPARLRAGWPADTAPVSGAPLRRNDVAIAILFFALGAIATFIASGLLDRRLLDNETMDVWFEADIPRTFEILTNRWTINDRAKLHPIFALLVLPPVYALKGIFGLDPWVAVRVTYAGIAGVWAASLFALLRLMGCRRTDAIAFTLLGATSASAMFWFPIPETHTFASPTIVFALIVVAASAHRVVPQLLEVAVSAATLGVTVTNWMAGLLASLVRRPLRQTLQISVGAFALVVALWVVQKQFIPLSSFFIGKTVTSGHILAPESHGPLHIGEVLLVHAVVMPEITVADRPGAGKWPVMLIQPANPGSAGVWSMISAVLWCALLGAGLWAMVRLPGKERLRIYLALLLAGQFALYILFGNETFLYAPNFLPILIAIAALAALTPARRVVLIGVMALIVTNTIGNVMQWRRARDFFVTFAPFHHDYQATKQARPEGPWPSVRAGKQLEIAPVDTRFFETGFATTAGGFSPGLDQFVISLWVLNDSGGLIATSDNLPRDQVESKIERRADSSVAKLDISTPYYQAGWSSVGPRRWQLDLTIPPGPRVALAVRGVGPQRAPVRQLDWNGTRLLVNDRWSVEPDAKSIAAYLVDENEPAWITARPDARQIYVIDGWAAARLELFEPGAHRIIVRDTSTFGPIDRVISTLPPGPRVDELLKRASADGGSRATTTGAAKGSSAAGPSPAQR